MILIQWKPSTELRQAFEAGLRHLVQLGRVSPGLNVNPNPHPIYVLNSQEEGGVFRLPSNIRLVGWRFFAGEPSGEIVVGDVSATTPPTVNSLYYGSSARNIYQATLALERLGEVDASDFHLRLLRIPGALFEGFWLKPASNNDGLIVPYGRSFDRERQDGKPFEIHDFLRTLRSVDKQFFRRKDSQER
ncbi:MAG: hypothetical protein ACJ73N_09825 [Bryobacteraceae bacterium]